MQILSWLLGLAAFLAAATVAVAYVCYRMAFYAPPRRPSPDDPIDTPQGDIYDPFRPQMEIWAAEARKLPHENVSITSFDGLKLTGKYYEYAPGATIELMFHGYRGNAERDLSGGVQRCAMLGRSALLVDQRCSGGSDGHVITFGVKEHRDCLSWLEFMVEKFGPEQKIILTGISMGAATVLCCADKELPPNVVGILADCGYDSPKTIIQEVIRQMKLPAELAYPFVKLGAKLFGHFDLEGVTPISAMPGAKVPVIFFHGEADAFVPCSMSRVMYEVCGSRKQLVTVPGAGHGLSFPMDQEGYLQAAREFFAEV